MTKLRLEVVSQEKKLLDLQVDAVTAPASEGEVTILIDHIPLFAKLRPGEIRYKLNGKEYVILVAQGFLNVDSDGHVTVIVDSAFEARELSLKKAQSAINEAKASLKTAKSKEELIKAEAALRFALLQEKIAQKTRLEKI